MEAEKIELQQQLEFVQLELEEQKVKNENLKKMNESLNNIINSQGLDSIRVKSIQDQLITEIDDVSQSYIKGLEQVKDRYKANSYNMEKENRQLRLAIKNLEFDMKQLQIKKDQENLNQQSYIQKLKAEMQDLAKQLEYLQQEISRRNQERSQEYQLNENEDHHDQIPQETEEALYEMRDYYEAEAEKMQTIISQLQTKLQRKKLKITDLSTELQQRGNSDIVRYSTESVQAQQAPLKDYNAYDGTFSLGTTPMNTTPPRPLDLIEQKDKEIRELKLKIDQLHLQNDRLQVELDKTQLELKQSKYHWAKQNQERQNAENVLKTDIKLIIGKLLKAKSKLAAESELNETMRREGILSAMRFQSLNSSHKSPSPTVRPISALDISAITRSESPFGASDYD